MKHKKLLVVGAAIGTVIALVVGATFATRSVVVRNSPASTRTETRKVGPSGQTGTVVVGVGNGTENATPVDVGSFHIVSRDWVDPNASSTPSPTSRPASVATAGTPIDPRDIATLQASPLWTAIGYTPLGFKASTPRATVENNGIASITWVFQEEGTTSTLQLLRERRSAPIEIQRPVQDGFIELKVGSINGEAAIFLQAKPGQFGPQGVIWVDKNGIYNAIDGEVRDFNELVKMASSVTP